MNDEKKVKQELIEYCKQRLAELDKNNEMFKRALESNKVETSYYLKIIRILETS